jgi:MULE transposase domain
MDGTFQTAPPLFMQIYTIHAKVDGQFFPLAIALLPDKQEVTYRRMMVNIQQKALTNNLVFNPQTVHCDFEAAAMNAGRIELGVEPNGCLFDYTQSIFRHVQSLGLQVKYNTDMPPGTRKWIRRLMGLPLVPNIRIQQVYNAIVAQAPNLPECQAMHQYVYQTYVDQNNALFPCCTWNVFGLENRTTNMCEGFHLALKQAVMVKHPTLFRLIESLQNIEASNERVLGQLALGAPPKKKKAKYVAVNEAIKRLADNTFAIALPSLQSVLQYLDAVAFQLWDVKH